MKSPTALHQPLLAMKIQNCASKILRSGFMIFFNLNISRERKNLQRQSWEKIAQEFLKKFTSKNRQNSGLTHSEEDNWFLGSEIWKTSTESVFFNINIHKDTSSENLDNFNSTLQNYGPWGYLMLAMLVCGTFLMFCGMWECCCKKEKPPSTPASSTATTAVVHHTTNSPSSTATTVLIINQPTHDVTQEVQGPPNYEDLDQPPSYNVLFPGNKTMILRQGDNVSDS